MKHTYTKITKSPQQISNRYSNAELLRIISILMITIHHFLVNPGMYFAGIMRDVPIVPHFEWATILNGFCYIGVNCFLLISGFFGIKFRWKRLFELWLTCIFCAIITFGLSFLKYGTLAWTDLMKESIFCFTCGSAWFVRTYVVLMLLAPILNFARDNMTKSQYIYAILIMTILSVYGGYFMQLKVFNNNGYTLGQFIFLYFVGAYLSKYSKIIQNHRWIYFAIYILTSLGWSMFTIAKLNGETFSIGPLSIWSPFTYNNPFILVSAISFFCFIMTFKFNIPCINYIAKSTLSVYLLSISGVSLVNSLMLSFIKRHLSTCTLSFESAILIVLLGTILLFIFSIGIDQIRRLIMTPFLSLWDALEKRHLRVRQIKKEEGKDK